MISSIKGFSSNHGVFILGIPVGVIAVETRATETIIPADPASVDSREQKISEAGQVWYPNSAFKTAQAIRDFNYGEQLPLIIFANWRGFSGGQSDMYKEILKYGSCIVDALREYQHPIFVYIVGELRGGAWVVLDPSINPSKMEMYAESNSRGSVLEPEGVVEIKFRKNQMQAAMERLDSKCSSLREDLNSFPDKKEALQRNLDVREGELSPTYHQIATHFADLHDGALRMKSKGVIREIVVWNESRRYFYHRLSRRLAEEDLYRRVSQAFGRSSSPTDDKELVSKWFDCDGATNDSLSSIEHEDERFCVWVDKAGPAIKKRLAELEQAQSKRAIMERLSHSKEDVVTESIKAYLDGLTPEKRQNVLSAFI